MRNTVLLLLLVAFASAAPVSEDADEQNILQMLQNVDPYENDILDNNDIELSKSNEYEKVSQEEDNNDINHTTEYTVEAKSEIDTDYSQESVTESEIESEKDLDSNPAVEVQTAPEELSNNATKIDYIVETEEQLEPNYDTEFVNEPNDSINVEETEFEDFGPMIIESPQYAIKSPQYAIKFPEYIPEIETTDFDDTSIEDGLYSNEEWPERYAPDFPVIPETPQMEDMPEISIDTLGNPVYPEGFIPEIYDSGAVGPMGPAYQINNEQPSGQFVDIVPIVDAWSNTYPDPNTFNSNPEVNQFGGDGIAHEMIDDITIEPIYYDQVPKFYDENPDSSLNGELPLEMLEEPDVMDNTNENSEDGIELIVLNEEMNEMPFTPIAEEVEQPKDSPIIPTAILQDTRPDVDILGLFSVSGDAEELEQPNDSPIIPTTIVQDTRPGIELLGLFDESGDAVIIEEIEEKSYPLDEDFVEENLPNYEVSPNETLDQDDIIIGISDETVLKPFDMVQPLMHDLEQVTVPDMPVVQEPQITMIEDDHFLIDKENNQRIYFDNEVRKNIHIFPQPIQSNPDFMVPQVHDQFPFGNENFQPHSYNENIDYQGEIPNTQYHDDIPHTHNGNQFNFDNAPHHNYFEDISGSMKRNGAHMVPDMDNMEMPIMEMGDMEIFNSPMMGPTKSRPTPQITVILVTKPHEVKDIWSRFIRPMQPKPFLPVDMPQNVPNLNEMNDQSPNQHRFNNEIQENGPQQFDNMGQFPQSPKTNPFNQNFYGQNFNEQPIQNYNQFQNMNSPRNQLFNSGMGPFPTNFNQQQPNMGAMFPNLDMDLTLDDLEFIQLGDMEMENMFASQQPRSPYGPRPSMFSFSNQQQNWPSRYAPDYQEMNFANNGPFYPQQNINRPFFIPS